MKHKALNSVLLMKVKLHHALFPVLNPVATPCTPWNIIQDPIILNDFGFFPGMLLAKQLKQSKKLLKCWTVQRVPWNKVAALSMRERERMQANGGSSLASPTAHTGVANFEHPCTKISRNVQLIFSSFSTTGCPTISVTSGIPLFSDICWWTRLPFHVLNKQWGRFDFLKKIFEIFFLVLVRPRYGTAWFSGSACFAVSLSSPRAFNFLAWKSHHMVNLTQKIHFRGLIWGAALQGEVGIQGQPVVQHLPVLCR